MLQCSVLGTLLLFSWYVHTAVFCAWHTAVTLMDFAYMHVHSTVLLLVKCLQ